MGSIKGVLLCSVFIIVHPWKSLFSAPDQHRKKALGISFEFTFHDARRTLSSQPPKRTKEKSEILIQLRFGSWDQQIFSILWPPFWGDGLIQRNGGLIQKYVKFEGKALHFFGSFSRWMFGRSLTRNSDQMLSKLVKSWAWSGHLKAGFVGSKPDLIC